MTTISKVHEKLRDPDYRSAYVASQISIGIPFQLRALLKSRDKTQEWLAEKTGMLQPRISGLMSPGKTRPNIETLRRLADAFDCGLAVRFVPFSELAGWSESFDPEEFSVPCFDDDRGFDIAAQLADTAEQPELVTAEDNTARSSSEDGVLVTSGTTIPDVEVKASNVIVIDTLRGWRPEPPRPTDATAKGSIKIPPQSATIETPERNTHNG